jgi:hypothetical protein
VWAAATGCRVAELDWQLHIFVSALIVTHHFKPQWVVAFGTVDHWLHSSQCNMLGSEAFVCMVLHVHPLLKLLVVVGVALHASYVEHG